MAMSMRDLELAFVVGILRNDRGLLLEQANHWSGDSSGLLGRE